MPHSFQLETLKVLKKIIQYFLKQKETVSKIKGKNIALSSLWNVTESNAPLNCQWTRHCIAKVSTKNLPSLENDTQFSNVQTQNLRATHPPKILIGGLFVSIHFKCLNVVCPFCLDGMKLQGICH